MDQSGTTPEIDIPAKDENLRLGRVGIIAAVGFVLGIAWPRLAGVKLVPEAPADNEGATPAASDSAEAPAAPPPQASARPVDAQGNPGEALDERMLVGEARVTSCQDEDGRNVKQCDEPDLASLVLPRLKALSGCDGAENLTRGTLSLGFELDFKKNKIERFQRGQSTTLPKSRSEKLLACAANEFATATLDGVKHEHPTYTVFYALDFLAPKAQSDPDATPEEPVEAVAASGRATVGWEVALIRDEPSRDSKVMARVLHGTRVAVTSRKGDWYRVKFDARGRQGWVFRTAIGL